MMLAGERQASLQAAGDINCLAFSTNMRLLALGIRDGPVRILTWPEMTLKTELRLTCSSW